MGRSGRAAGAAVRLGNSRCAERGELSGGAGEWGIKMLDIGREMNRYMRNNGSMIRTDDIGDTMNLDYLYATTTPNESNADGNLKIHNWLVRPGEIVTTGNRSVEERIIENKDPITHEKFTNGESVLVLEGNDMFKLSSLDDSFMSIMGKKSPMTRKPVTKFSDPGQIARYTLVIFPNAEPSSSSSSSSAAASTHVRLRDLEFIEDKGILFGKLLQDGPLTFIRIQNKSLQDIDSTILDPITHTRFSNDDKVIVAKGAGGRSYLFKRDPLLEWFNITRDNKLPINGDPVTLEDMRIYKLDLIQDDEAAASTVASASTSAAASVEPPNTSSSYALTMVKRGRSLFPDDRDFFKNGRFVFNPSFSANVSSDTATVSPKDTENIDMYVRYTDEEPTFYDRGFEKTAVMDGTLRRAVTVKLNSGSCSYTVPIGSEVRVQIVNEFNREQTRTIFLIGDHVLKEGACSIQGGAGGRRRRGTKRARRGRRRSSRKN